MTFFHTIHASGLPRGAQSMLHRYQNRPLYRKLKLPLTHQPSNHPLYPYILPHTANYHRESYPHVTRRGNCPLLIGINQCQLLRKTSSPSAKGCQGRPTR